MAISTSSLVSTIGDVGASIGNPILFGAEVIGGLLGGLLSGIFGGGDTKALEGEIQNLRQTVADTTAKATRFTWTLALALGALLQLFHDFFVGEFGELKDLVEKIGATLHTLLSGFLGKLLALLKWVWLKGIPDLISAIQKLRKWLNMIYLKYIRPILNYIQIIRRYLAILRIFHVKWAAKLDLELSRIEARILGPYLWVLRALNSYGGWLNTILTVYATIQRAVFIRTMFAYQGDWLNMFWQFQRPLSSTPVGAPTPATAPAPTITQVEADFSQWTTTGGGRYAVTTDRTATAFDTLINTP